MQYSEVRLVPGQALSGQVTPPGAKSGTVRAMLSATLADGQSEIIAGTTGANSQAMIRACETLGARITRTAAERWQVTGVGHALPESCKLDAGNSGIVLRLLAAVGARMQRCVVGTSVPESLGRRGNYELIDALRQLGAECSGQGEEACPPLVVGRGAGLHGGTVTISGKRSSQFLSGLLFLSPLIGEDVEIVISDELPASAMAHLTVAMLDQAGISVEVAPDSLRYRIAGGQRYQASTFRIPSDASSMAGLLASVAAVPGSEVVVNGFIGNDLGTGTMIETMIAMGVPIEREDGRLRCRGAQAIRPIELDGSRCPDSVLPLAALATFAHGTSVFRNVETLRYKECDRISDFRHELLAAGADVDEERDAIIVHGHGGVKGGGVVSGRHDHSVVMALAAIALRSEQGLTIRGADAVSQTYRNFFDDLASLGTALTAS